MIVGRRYWILIWYGFLIVGAAAAVASIFWGRRTAWRNLDEILRAFATMLLAGGMLLLLYEVVVVVGWALVAAGVALFLAAFRAGRAPRKPPPPSSRPRLH